MQQRTPAAQHRALRTTYASISMSYSECIMYDKGEDCPTTYGELALRCKALTRMRWISGNCQCTVHAYSGEHCAQTTFDTRQSAGRCTAQHAASGRTRSHM